MPDDIDAIHAVHAASDAVDHPTWITPREDVADTFDRRTSITLATRSSRWMPRAPSSRSGPPSRIPPGRVSSRSTSAAPSGRTIVGGHRLPGARVAGRARSRPARRGRADLGRSRRLPTDAWTADLVYGEESQPDQQAIAERAGLTAERWFTTMERDMAVSAPEVAAPDGIRVVPYTHDRDEDARLARNDAFRDHRGVSSQPESWAKFVGVRSSERPVPPRARRGRADRRLQPRVGQRRRLGRRSARPTVHRSSSASSVITGAADRALTVASSLAAIGAARLERAVLDVDTASPTGANSLYEGLHRDGALVASSGTSTRAARLRVRGARAAGGRRRPMTTAQDDGSA
jgi:hypothetical protein